MKKKTRVLIISYTAALVAALAVGLIACRTDANRRQTAMDANYRHAYGEVLNAVQELDSSLQKSLYATTAAMECTVCTDIYSAAQTAEMALGVLPVNSHALARIARNIALAGDYARTLSRNAAEGRTFTSEELEHLRAFSDATKQLSTQLAALGQSLYDGAVTTTAHVRSTESLENLGSEADLSDTLEAELAAQEAEKQDQRAHALDRGRAAQDVAHEAHDAAVGVAAQRLGQHHALPQADLTPQGEEEQTGDGHKAETADLDEQQDHHLAEHRPVRTGIDADEARDAGR